MTSYMTRNGNIAIVSDQGEVTFHKESGFSDPTRPPETFVNQQFAVQSLKRDGWKEFVPLYEDKSKLRHP